MGILQLFPFVQKIHRKVLIKDLGLAQKSIGIDGNIVLLQCLYRYTKNITSKGRIPPDLFEPFKGLIERIHSAGAKPYVVFDGCSLPAKKAKSAERSSGRARFLAQAEDCIALGDYKRASELIPRCLSVSTSLKRLACQWLYDNGVRFLVSPFEADAQLAYLARQKKIHAVMTEDTDLMLYDLPCPLIYKYDIRFNSAIVVDARDIPIQPDLEMIGWSPRKELRWMAVLTSTDYNEGIKFLGLKKSHGLIKHAQGLNLLDNVDVYKGIQILSRLAEERGFSVHPAFVEESFVALTILDNQYVFCPDQASIIPLSREINCPDYSSNTIKERIGSKEQATLYRKLFELPKIDYSIQNIISNDRLLDLLRKTTDTLGIVNDGELSLSKSSFFTNSHECTKLCLNYSSSSYAREHHWSLTS